MLIESPWYFDTQNINIFIEFEKEINLNSHFKKLLNGRNPNISLDLSKMVLSLCKMKSTISKEDIIEHNEVIIKIPVIFMNENYYYPILCFVDNEFSLIRGAYLGFDKLFSEINITKKTITAKSKYGSLKLNYRNLKRENKLDNYPFLLNREYRFSRHAKTSEFATPIVTNYELIKSEICDVHLVNQQLLSNIFDSFENYKICKADCTHEKYKIERIRCICKK